MLKKYCDFEKCPDFWFTYYVFCNFNLAPTFYAQYGGVQEQDDLLSDLIIYDRFYKAASGFAWSANKYIG